MVLNNLIVNNSPITTSIIASTIESTNISTTEVMVLGPQDLNTNASGLSSTPDLNGSLLEKENVSVSGPRQQKPAPSKEVVPLTTKDVPVVLPDWLESAFLSKWLQGHKYHSLPVIENKKKFVIEWLNWWNNLQPAWQRGSEMGTGGLGFPYHFLSWTRKMT
ncbi:hypothetical protein BYT27DRAFT_7218533 [Phlegmacium glaucopus]|nr:hypothetical protein BYT27DRAFT_7218533 [Phlegmacium glaucopus]